MRRLAVVNLTSSLALAAFGLYAWHLTVTRYVHLPVSRWSRGNSGGGLDLIYRHTTHTHATMPYVASAGALLAAALTLWRFGPRRNLASHHVAPPSDAEA